MAKRPSTSPTSPAPNMNPTTVPGDGPGISMGAFDDAAHPGGDEGEEDGAGPGPGPGPGQPAPAPGPGAYIPQPQPQPQSQPQSQFPPWPVNGGPKSFHGWIHSATDSKGHENRIPLRVQPAISRQIGITVGSKHFPYRTPQELVRHAIYEHLRWLETIDGTIPSVMGVVDSINALLLDEQMLQEQADVLGRHLAVVERHLQMGAFNSAHRVCATAFALLDTLPPGEWRDSYRLKFAQMYSGATAAGAAAPLPLPAQGQIESRGRSHRGHGGAGGAVIDHNPIPDEGGEDE